MKQLLRFGCLTLVATTFLSSASVAQDTRYVDPIFDSYEFHPDVPIGFNVDALRSNFSNLTQFGADMAAVNAFMADGEDVPLNYFVGNNELPEEQHTALKLYPMDIDVYTPPAEDTETDRPVIVYLHTGNFLPQVINGSPMGSKRDSAVVNHCKKWAKKGYVAIALNYRLGWNPISEDPDVRRGTLLQAVYRAIHDTQTAVRYMRSTVAQGDPYGIDPENIVLFGQGSGGYVALAYATLDDYDNEVAIDKFIGENGLPYVLEAVDGSIDGGPGAIRLPDPLQQAGISREVKMVVNSGGALADLSWLKEGDIPMVSIHCVRDPFAPFDDGTVVVPTTNEDVVDVSGANVFIPAANDFGNNSAFSNIPDGNDPYTDRARSLYGQSFEYILPTQPTMTIDPNADGLFPIVLPINTINGNRFTNEGAPWDWWDFATLEAVVAGTNAMLGLSGDEAYDASELHAISLLGHPDMGPTKGLAYIDTVQGYVNPRIMCVLGLDGNPCATSVTDRELNDRTTVFPNPSGSSMTLRNASDVIRAVEITDITGRLVRKEDVNANVYTIERNGLNDGLYLLQVIYDNNRITKKIVFN